MIGNKIKLSFIFTVLTLLLFSSFTVFAAQPTINAKRLSGANRYATSSAVALSKWTQSDYAILAYGQDFPDALSAAPLAKKYSAPILLTETNAIPEETLNTIKQLKVKNIIIIGGTGIVSSAVQNELTSMGITTSRIFGQDRYETSVKIAEQLDNVTEIAIVTGESFPDALSMSPIAVKKNMPIILVRFNEIPDVVKNYINSHKLSKTYVITQSGVPFDSTIMNGSNTDLIIGNDKYEINLNIIKKFKSDLDLSTVYLATGENFADALSGSILAGSNSNPLILIGNDISSVKTFFDNNSGTISNINVLGGTGAVKEEVINELVGSSTNSTPISTPTTNPTVTKIEFVSTDITKTGTNTATFKYRVLDQNDADITKTVPASELDAVSTVNSSISLDSLTGTGIITFNSSSDVDKSITITITDKVKGKLVKLDTKGSESAVPTANSTVSKLEIISKNLTKIGESTVTFQYRVLDQNGADITKTVPASDITSDAIINSGYYTVSLDPLTGTGSVTYRNSLGDNIIASIILSCKNQIHTSATLYLEGSATQENNAVSQIIIYPDSAAKTGDNTLTFKYKILNKNYEDITKEIPASQIDIGALTGENVGESVTVDPSTETGTIVFKSASDTDKYVAVNATDKVSGVNAVEVFNNNEVTNQKISKIVFTSGLAVDKSGYGYACYRVEDQDGNDITSSNAAKSIRFKSDVGTIEVFKNGGGLFTITPNEGVDLSKLTSITITGYDTDSGFSMSGTIMPQ